MSNEPETWNYFNYYTEVEEHFQRARGTGLFLLSPLDWALIETWKNAEVPLEAVQRGIDKAFAQWRERKSKAKIQKVNSLAYCTQAVLEEAKIMAGAARPVAKTVEAPFTLDELRAHLAKNGVALSQLPAYAPIAATLEKLASEAEDHYADLEQLEQRLSALEDKMLATARAEQSEEDLFQARRDLDAELRPYRSRMTAEQLTMLEKQYLDRRLLERSGLPRLSLFYLR